MLFYLYFAEEQILGIQLQNAQARYTSTDSSLTYNRAMWFY